MLTSLQRILREVDSAPDLAHLLESVINEIKNTVSADLYSIYLHDDELGKYVLSATSQIDKSLVNKLYIPTGKGLVSLITERAEPLNIENAIAHPRYYMLQTKSETSFHGFLGAPIIHRKQTLGVIVLQSSRIGRFEAEDEAFLVTLCAQLAGTIAAAKTSGHFSALVRGEVSGRKVQNVILHGVPCVSGIAIGKATVIYPQADLNAIPDQSIEDIPAELNILEQGLIACRKDIDNLKQRLATSLSSKDLALFDAYLNMLDDHSLGLEIRDRIKTGLSAQTALRDTIAQHEQHYAVMNDVYLRERITDIRSLGQRLLACLQAQQRITRTYPPKTILVGEEISAADLAEVPEGRLAAIVSATGSINSHVAILARALSIPAVLGIEGLPVGQLDKQELIIDGTLGHVFIAATPKLRRRYTDLLYQEQQEKADLLHLRDLPAETLDGHQVSLRVNVGLTINRGSSLRINAEGVGLFRSEVAFLAKERFPTEEEQRIIYRQLLTAFAPRPVIMRTLDIGGDKTLDYFGVEEQNPALGWRGIRVTLDHPEIFLVQIRAMLRASEGLNNLLIMFPMISTISEIHEAKKLLYRAMHELREEGLNIAPPSIGVMIEVPAMVYQADHIAQHVDFVSVGSNDLIQHLLAVDRNNAYVAHLYQSLHPAVLFALNHIVTQVKAAGKWVSICGEMAADPLAIPLLTAMGFDCLSTHSSNLLQVKSIIRSLHFQETKGLLAEALTLDSAEKIIKLVKNYIKKPVVDMVERR